MSNYGYYRNNTFCDLFPSASSFLTDYKASGIYTSNTGNRLADADATTLYYLLYAKYGNSSIAASDTNRFKYALWSIIFSYGPAWIKKLEVQATLRGLSEADLLVGSKAIYNHAYNPGTAPSTSELEAINEQNTQSYKKSKLDAYGSLLEFITADVTQEFLGKFKKLFLTFVYPEMPLWYDDGSDD